MTERIQKILFIDDDELVSEFAIMTMEAEGFEVLYCMSGQKALEEVVAFSPQLILLDVLMPDMDGIETFKALSKIPKAENIPVIFLTGLAGKEDEQSYKDMGALGLIAKPFDPGTLCDKIKALWQTQHG